MEIGIRPTVTREPDRICLAPLGTSVTERTLRGTPRKIPHSTMLSVGDATKRGHYSSSCPNTQRVFMAQVIEEDGETEPQIPSEKPNDNGESHVEQDDPVEDQPDDPNGSQYDSTQEGFPLDEYEEYVEF